MPRAGVLRRSARALPGRFPVSLVVLVGVPAVAVAGRASVRRRRHEVVAGDQVADHVGVIGPGESRSAGVDDGHHHVVGTRRRVPCGLHADAGIGGSVVRLQRPLTAPFRIVRGDVGEARVVGRGGDHEIVVLQRAGQLLGLENGDRFVEQNGLETISELSSTCRVERGAVFDGRARGQRRATGQSFDDERGDQGCIVDVRSGGSDGHRSGPRETRRHDERDHERTGEFHDKASARTRMLRESIGSLTRITSSAPAWCISRTRARTSATVAAE
ncbi:unannotated protein [freshwater metagenome]|uniref:Unannotated protein n=1 Tax=freshwater metagenome TaxID=449393 RepID=A0A6J6E2G2_9ZZZZ